MNRQNPYPRPPQSGYIPLHGNVPQAARTPPNSMKIAPFTAGPSNGAHHKGKGPPDWRNKKDHAQRRKEKRTSLQSTPSKPKIDTSAEGLINAANSINKGKGKVNGEERLFNIQTANKINNIDEHRHEKVDSQSFPPVPGSKASSKRTNSDDSVQISSKRRKIEAPVIELDDSDSAASSKDIIDLTSDSETPVFIEKEISASYMGELSTAILDHFRLTKQRKQIFERKRFLRDGIQSLITGIFHEGTLHLTGSSMSGFGANDSDADMALIFDPFGDISKKDATRQLRRLASCLKNQAYCTQVEVIPAKVPIVKFHDTISRCDVDININNTVGIKNSFLLKAISLVDERIPALVLTVKAWAKAYDINNARFGTLSSYTIVIMIIHFLQAGITPAILPPLEPFVRKLIRVNVNTELQKLTPGKFIEMQTENTDTLGVLFLEFLKFWSKELKQKRIYSINSGGSKIRTYNNKVLDNDNFCLCLEEPILRDNVARAVRGYLLKNIIAVFEQTKEDVMNEKTLEYILSPKSEPSDFDRR